MKIRGESGSVPARMGGSASSTSRGGGRLGVSVRSTQVDPGTKRLVKKQNKAADSYRIKDMDQLEKGRAYRAEKKLIDAAKKAQDLKKAERKGLVKGAAATAGVGVSAVVVSKDKKKKTPKPKK